MFGRSHYLAWASRFYGRVPYDLATSGIPLVRVEDLGVSLPPLDDPGGYAELRHKIAVYNDVTDAEVIPAVGASGGIFLAYAAMVSPGDDVLVERPGYEPLTRAAEGLGARVVTFDRRRENGFRVVPEEVAARVTPRTRAIVVTNLHNPTGVREGDATLLELARIAEARGALLVVDEVYAPFDDLPEDGVFRGSARRIAPNVVAIGSLTKCYGLGMHRIGWVIGPPEVIAHAEAATLAMFGHLPLSHANIGAAAFSAVGTLARRAKSISAGKLAIAEEWAASIHRRAHWSAPREGLFGFVTAHDPSDLTPRIEKLATDAGVLVGAGSFFGIPNGFRLSWATCDDTTFREGLLRVESLF